LVGHTFTTLSIPTPASVNMPTMFSQHCFVLSAMLPSIKFPFVSAGIWPETKICGPAMMAWDYWGVSTLYIHLAGMQCEVGILTESANEC
jgi:hypothetical protein